MKRAGLWLFLIATNSHAALGADAPAPDPSVSATAQQIYITCFAASEASMARDLKVNAYAQLVATNSPKTHEVRGYVDGPFSEALQRPPSPITLAFKTAALEIAAKFTSSETGELLNACRKDPKSLPMPADLRQRAIKIVGEAQLAQTRIILRRTRNELRQRHLETFFREDANAYVLMGMFDTICLKNRGKPDGVRSFAADRHYPEITDENLLRLYVGPGGKGAAWTIVPAAPRDRFVLSLRGDTQGCAVWVGLADPGLIESTFAERMAPPFSGGLQVKKEPERTQQTANGAFKYSVYVLHRPPEPIAELYTVITAEQPAGLFQASIQTAVVRAR